MEKPTTKRSRAFALGALFLVNVFWGLSFIASKFALTNGFQPMTLAFWRYVVACLVMVPAALLREGRPRIEKADTLPLILSALFGITFYYFFEYTGMVYTTASTASLIIATIPVFSLLYAVLFKKMRVGRMRVLCTAVSLAGVFLVIRFGEGGGEGLGSMKGNLLILACCLCWVAYIEFNAKLRGRLPSLTLTACQSVIALATLFPFALREGELLPAAPPMAWACVVALAVVCSALCYFLYAEALGSVEAFTASMFININPISAVIAGFLLLGERLSPLQLMGGGLILGSLMLANRAQVESQSEA